VQPYCRILNMMPHLLSLIYMTYIHDLAARQNLDMAIVQPDARTYLLKCAAFQAQPIEIGYNFLQVLPDTNICYYILCCCRRWDGKCWLQCSGRSARHS
jgi:hypothetical protein